MKHTLHIKTLENGTRILFVNLAASSSYYFNTINNAGFNYVDISKHELPHLLEHLAFEGSKNYPKEGQIGYELEKLGGWYNAATSDDYIRYYLVGSMNDYKKITELALEQYTQPLFREENINQQKSVVERELRRKIDDDSIKVRSLAMEQLFSDKLFSLKSRIDTLKHITKLDIENYYAKTHTQANTNFVVAGDIDSKKQKEITSVIEQRISTLPVGESLHEVKKLNTSNLAKVYTLPSKLEEQMYFLVTFIKGKYDNDMQYRAASRVVSAIYNRGDGSRIFRKSRSAGLTYGVHSGIFNDEEYSELYITDKTDPHLAQKLFKLCVNELIDIKNGNFTLEELERAKGYMAGENDTEFETSRDLADWYGPLFVAKDKLYSPKDFARAIRSVTKEDVLLVLNKFIRKDNWLITLVGHNAINQASGFEKIIKDSII